ncbi:hypothetical protein HOD30_00070 [Candidatus Peregrinibacteria bacterium]|jgi:hypothetical protein|nr:hypothetical protein [Candidatus Peregrinibacteria bacterium]MBT4632397.1 hypothetical protein [Candidatus Peregrinibacteria bacterium]MBT5517042.1 hypothetical protein [Candidatus Peregrinibacteria bacterium]MBT5823601.1 hypothetical protein [Candidatus Peregrinibacteria bacterium]
MNKPTLKRLGQLWRIQEELHNLWVQKNYDNETAHKIKLVTKVKKNLEEQKRGFMSKRVSYSKIADFIILHYEELGAQALHDGIVALVIARPDL